MLSEFPPQLLADRLPREPRKTGHLCTKTAVRLGPHRNSVVSLLCFSDELIANGEAGTFDMVYIDADKWNYTVYYDKCVELVRKGGLILLDDVSIVC